MHHENLHLYIELGAIITKVHRAIGFEERAWLAPYINLNTKKRQAAVDEYERAFYKLLNNALFGELDI